MRTRPEIGSQKSAVERAREIYRKNKLSFQEDIDSHLADGFVLSLPNCFALARAVELHDGRRAWFVKMAVGELRQLLALMPFPMPFIAFRRSKSGGHQRVYSTARLLRLVNQQSSLSPS